MDVMPPRKLRGEDYPCLHCWYRGDSICANCIFARWNIEGIMAGFHPKQSYRQQHRQDLTQSPLIQTMPSSPHAQVLRQFEERLHPKLSRLVIPSYNRIKEVLESLGEI